MCFINRIGAYIYFGFSYVICKCADEINKLFDRNIIKPKLFKNKHFKHSYY